MYIYKNDDLYFISVEFEHSLENEIANHSDQLAMRKIAVVSYKTPSHASLSPTNKHPNTDSCLQHNTHDEKSTKKHIWNKSPSKDG